MVLRPPRGVRDEIVLEDKLEEARLHSVKRRKQITIGLFATICLCGLVVIGLSYFDFSTNKNVQVVTSNEEKQSENVQVVASNEEKPSENEQVVVSNEEKQSENEQVGAFNEEKQSGLNRAKIRGQYIEILQQYQNDLEPRLQTVDVEHWNRDAFLEISELKEKAMSHFSDGEYSEALENLQVLNTRTVEILDEAEQNFKENLEKAASFWAEDLYDEAKLHIEKALMVAPQSPEALKIQQKIEKLPSLLPLLNEVKVARLENDLQKEYAVLQQVLQDSPERDGVTQRLEELAQLIQSQKFDAHISAGFADIEDRKVQEARYNYQEAEKVDPGRPELALLLDQLLALEKSLRVQRAIKQAEQAVRQDDWQQAKSNFAKAAKDAPENKTVAEGLKRADLVLGLQDRFRQYFENPYRLSNENVLSEAENTLMQADIASGYSFGIKRQAEQLRELITKLNRLISVTIISDGKTYVLVRRVGKVGVVSQKDIQLKPGNYTFEGARDGFKSKLVQAFIPYDQDNFSVRVICDEPI
jgi:hypothetical protein